MLVQEKITPMADCPPILWDSGHHVLPGPWITVLRHDASPHDEHSLRHGTLWISGVHIFCGSSEITLWKNEFPGVWGIARPRWNV